MAVPNYSNTARTGEPGIPDAMIGGPQFRSAKGDAGTTGYGAARQYSGSDTELERLRRVEANYEKDKAMLAKEKAPALARSESHDIGHAETDEEIDLSEIARRQQKVLIQELRGRKGI
jgi:hypothetical protein